MTHRAMAVVPISGFDPGDSSKRSLKLVRTIVSGWDGTKFKPPVAVTIEAAFS